MPLDIRRSAIGRAPDSLVRGPGFDTVWQHTFVSPSAFSRRAVVSYWRKYVHERLVNRLGGLSLPRKSVVRLTDRPDMNLDVYRGRKTTIQQQLDIPTHWFTWWHKSALYHTTADDTYANSVFCPRMTSS